MKMFSCRSLVGLVSSILCVLQKRHLLDRPLEYLIKLRAASRSAKCRELWVPVEQLCEHKFGTKLIELFEESKVGLQGVDAYLPKRRSLSSHEQSVAGQQTANNSNSAGHPKSSHDLGINGVKRPSTDGAANNLPANKVPPINHITSEHAHNSDQNRSKGNGGKKQAHNSNKRIKLSHFDSKPVKAVDLLVSNSKDISVSSDSESDDDIRYMLVENKESLSKSLTDKVEPKNSATDSSSKQKKSGVKTERLSLLPKNHPNRSGSNGISKKLDRVASVKSSCSSSVSSAIQFKSSNSGVPSRENSEATTGHSGHRSTAALSLASSSQVHLANQNHSEDNIAHKVSPNLPSSTLRSKKLENPSENCNVSVDSSNSIDARRLSVRQSEQAYRFKEIVVRKLPGFVQLSLVTHTVAKNALNPKVFQELSDALHNALFDDSRVVLLTGSGSVFCSGIDLHYLLTAPPDRRAAAKEMADSLRDFVAALLAFPKPIIAAVNGPAIGFGVALLALCDVVYASDKASFSCPYAKLCQTPEGCASFTLPKMMGIAMANELFLCGRKITAVQACQAGLVSQVFWPTNMMQEVIPRVQTIVSQSAKAMELTKSMVQCHRRNQLEQVNLNECRLLAERWPLPECQQAIQSYVDSAHDVL